MFLTLLPGFLVVFEAYQIGLSDEKLLTVRRKKLAIVFSSYCHSLAIIIIYISLMFSSHVGDSNDLM